MNDPQCSGLARFHADVSSAAGWDRNLAPLEVEARNLGPQPPGKLVLYQSWYGVFLNFVIVVVRGAVAPPDPRSTPRLNPAHTSVISAFGC
jgi:hypothetical protein